MISIKSLRRYNMYVVRFPCSEPYTFRNILGIASRDKIQFNQKEFAMSITGKDYRCSACGHHFLFQSDGEEREGTHDYKEAMKCPACNAVVRQKRGSGRDRGQSNLHYGPCPKCGSQTELFPIQGGGYTALCPECARAYSSSSY